MFVSPTHFLSLGLVSKQLITLYSGGSGLALSPYPILVKKLGLNVATDGGHVWVVVIVVVVMDDGSAASTFMHKSFLLHILRLQFFVFLGWCTFSSVTFWMNPPISQPCNFQIGMALIA